VRNSKSHADETAGEHQELFTRKQGAINQAIRPREIWRKIPRVGNTGPCGPYPVIQHEKVKKRVLLSTFSVTCPATYVYSNALTDNEWALCISLSVLVDTKSTFGRDC